MRRVAAVALSLALASLAYGEDATEPDWPRIQASCQAFLDMFSSPEETQRLAKKLDDRVTDRVSSSPSLSRDSAARDIMLDWAADNRKRLCKKERDAMVQACFYFITFRQKGYLIPKYIREELTPKNVDGLCSYLDDEVKKGSK